MTTTHLARATSSGPSGTSRSRTTLVPLAAAAAAAAVWALSRLLDVDLVVGAGAGRQVVGLPSVLAVALLAAVLGTLAHRLLGRVTRRPAAWPLLAGAVLLVSLAGPAGAATPAAGLLLVAMHLGVGLVVILGQPRTRAGRR